MEPYNEFSGAQRQRAREELNLAFASGRFKRPVQCEACGSNYGRIDAHLEDYDRPETFMGLCYNCHMMVHSRLRSPEAFQRYHKAIMEGAYFRTPTNWTYFKHRFLESAKLPAMDEDMSALIVWHAAPPRHDLLGEIVSGAFDPRRMKAGP